MHDFEGLGERDRLQTELWSPLPIIILTVTAIEYELRQYCRSGSSGQLGSAAVYPIPVCFFSSASVFSAVTIGECSYSPVRSSWISRSTACQIK